MAAYEIVWWGARNGRFLTSPRTGPAPATEAMIVAMRASSSPRGGSRLGTVRARSVLPDPGGPIITRQWPPASAISIPRRASNWPLTSSRSGPPPLPALDAAAVPGSLCSSARFSANSTRGGRCLAPPRRLSLSNMAASASVAAPTTSTPPARRASTSPSAGTMMRLTRRPAKATTMGRSPGTGLNSPPSDSSPRTAQRPSALTCSEPTRIPRAMARSKEAPLLRSSAGARFTVMRRGGYS
jgi:hypothetical protein